MEDIKKMMEYLKLRETSTFVYANERPSNVKRDKKFDHEKFYITLENGNIKMNYYAYDESHHNGDHYNCHGAKEIPQSAIDRIRKLLTEECVLWTRIELEKQKRAAQIKQEEEEAYAYLVKKGIF